VRKSLTDAADDLTPGRPAVAGRCWITSSNAASSVARKQAVDKENKRQMEAAKAMEKARLAQEAEAMKRHQAELKAMEEETKPPKGPPQAQRRHRRP